MGTTVACHAHLECPRRRILNSNTVTTNISGAFMAAKWAVFFAVTESVFVAARFQFLLLSAAVQINGMST